MQQGVIDIKDYDKKDSCIYSIKNIDNNKIYIGSTKNFHKRAKDHKNDLKGSRHGNIHLQRSFNLGNILEMKIVEKCLEESLVEREKYYMKIYDSKNRDFGYNICDPLRGPCKKLTKQQIENLAEARRRAFKIKGMKKQEPEHIFKAAKGKWKKVDVFDSNKNLLFTSDSMIDAENKTGVKRQNISLGCRLRKYILGGYIFRYHSENIKIN